MKRTPLRRKTPLKRKSSKPKLPTVRSLEQKVWELCKQITRKRYGNTCYTCGKTDLTPYQSHTGHFRKKSILPMQMKYDLRLLRIQCPGCNLFQDGNEGAYAIQLLKDEGPEYLLKLDEDIKYHKNNLMGAVDSRIFLQSLIEEYKNILGE